MSNIAILIPCYNEAATIEKVMRDYKNVLPDATIYVYDNNSTDETAQIAEKMGGVVRREYRQGKGNVIRSMFHDIDADAYLMIDGDDTYPAEHAHEMVQLILEGKADMVIGDRLSSTYFEENKRPFHNIGNVMVRYFINKLWRPKEPIIDVMTGYRAFSRRFVKTFPILSEGFEIETEMTIHALDKNLLLKSIPVNYRDRPEGSVSKLNTYKDGAKVLMTIFNLFRDYKPLKFFGLIALLVFILATILFALVLDGYLETGLVAKFPTLFVSMMLYLASFLALVCGLILDTNAKNARKNLEIQINIIESLLSKDR